jgi:hypothetical protein
MKKQILIAILLTCCTTAHASEITHRAAAESMLQATKVEKNLTSVYEQMSRMIEQQFKKMDVPEDAIPILTKYRNKQIDVMKEELSWQKLKDDIASAYMKVYSEEEIRELTKFFTSPIGTKYVEKMPELTQEMMKSIQNRIPILTEKYRQIGEELAADMEKYDKARQKGR